MTGRQCLQDLLGGSRAPRLCWTTLVDDRTRSVMPQAVQQLPLLDFYRHLGCDLLQFGNYGLPPDLAVPPAARRLEPPTQIERTPLPDGSLQVCLETEWGVLTSCTRGGHFSKYPVETLEDVRVARRLWERTSYEPDPQHAPALQQTEAALGDLGVFVPTLEPSPVQQLLEMDMGLIAFYGLLQDYRREVEGLLEAMHAARLQEWEITARSSPATAFISVENTSSTLISPALYRRYSLPQLRDYVDACHAHGKLLVLHMCGLLRDLLPMIAETGYDGVNALTPPPHGDTTVEQALDLCGEDLLILGGMLDGSVFQAQEVSAAELREVLERLYMPRVRKARLLLCLGADGLPTPLERFEAVRDWFAQQNGG